MMMGYGFNPFAMVFMLVYLGVVIYFFYLLTNMAKSLRRISNVLEKKFTNDEENHPPTSP